MESLWRSYLLMAEQHLEDWVQSLDKEVTVLGRSNAAMRSSLEAQSAQLSKIESGLEHLLQVQGTPKPPIQIIAAVSTLIAFISAFAIFIELRLGPTEFMLEELTLRAQTQTQTTHVLMSEQSALEASGVSRTMYIDHLSAENDKSEERIITLIEKVASLEAVGET